MYCPKKVEMREKAPIIKDITVEKYISSFIFIRNEMKSFLDNSVYTKSIIFSVYSGGITAVNDKYVREILKTGSLTKRGHKIKSFKERWFVLNPHLISYYEGKSSAGKKKGVIILAEVQYISIISPE